MSSKPRPEKILDINGWDLRKSLQRMRRSNPPLNEWLASSIRYRAADKLQALDHLSQSIPKNPPRPPLSDFDATFREILSRLPPTLGAPA